jgi:hypothetical protein
VTAVEPPADERDGDAVTAAELEQPVARPNLEPLDRPDDAIRCQPASRDPVFYVGTEAGSCVAGRSGVASG